MSLADRVLSAVNGKFSTFRGVVASGAPRFDVTEVGDYVGASGLLEVPLTTSRFPCVAPPFAALWMEQRIRPSRGRAGTSEGPVSSAGP